MNILYHLMIHNQKKVQHYYNTLNRCNFMVFQQLVNVGHRQIQIPQMVHQYEKVLFSKKQKEIIILFISCYLIYFLKKPDLHDINCCKIVNKYLKFFFFVAPERIIISVCEEKYFPFFCLFIGVKIPLQKAKTLFKY
jgi:hypothetical protein